MPPKKIHVKDALKKTRKNFKKVFKDEGRNDDFQFLNNFLFSNITRELINVYDGLQMCDLDDTINTANYDIFCRIRDVLDDLLPISEENDEAMELTDILTNSHMKGYVEAVSNVAAREFVPQITVGSVVQASSLHSLHSDHHSTVNRSVTDVSIGLLPDLKGESIHSQGSLAARSRSRSPYGIYVNSDHNGNRDDDAYVKDLDDDAMSSTLNNGVTLVGIPKDRGENLGMTVGIKNMQLDRSTTLNSRDGLGYGSSGELRSVIVVERVMTGSKIEQRRLLAPGDVITEINGTIVDSPEQFQKLMKAAEGIVTLKVLPVPRQKQLTTQLFVRAFFAYDPQYDTLIPCKEAGLAFMPGDILHVLNQGDIFWWQARHVNAKERAGLIPTEYLEERRRAHMINAKDPNEIKYKMFGLGIGKKKKKVKVDYSVNNAADYDRSDITMYEEVTQIKGFKRRVICLLGASGVGRSTIRDELLRRFPDKYACPMRDTSRVKRTTDISPKYNFVDPEIMMMEHVANNYVDFGEYNGSYYGIHIRTIRELIRSSRTCLIDCNAETVKHLRTVEFMPYVMFLAAPSIDCMRAMYEYGQQTGLTDKYKNDEEFHNAIEESIETEREYRHWFDDVVVVDNMAASFDIILDKLTKLETTPQWVPAKWVY